MRSYSQRSNADQELARPVIRAAGFAVLFFAAAPLLPAQSLSLSRGEAGSPQQGFHIESLSAYGSYYSEVPLLGNSLGSDFAVGGSATVGWTRTRSHSSVLWTYTPSYTRDITFSQWNSLNHAFSLNANRSLGPSWNVGASAAAEVMNTSEFLFRPSVFSQVVETAATADQLADAILGGIPLDNAHLAALLTGAPLLESPARQLFFGDRLLNASAQATASYRKARLGVSFLAGSTRLQNLSTPKTDMDGQLSYLVPASTAGQAGVSLMYSLSPRTRTGISVATQRTISRFEDVYESTATASFGRRMGREWFIEMHGGAGAFTATRSVFTLPQGPQYLAGGSLGFRTRSHSFLLSSDRTISEIYGIGASSTWSSTFGWNWGHPGRSWRLFASGNQQRIESSSFPTVNAWGGTAGYARSLTRSSELDISYAYIQSTSAFTGLPNNWATHGVRVTITWAP